jgi:hypothetical protein
MFQCVTEIAIEQQGEGRKKKLLLDFCTEVEFNDSWLDLTNKAKVVFPKNIYVRDETGNLFPLGGKNKNVGGFDSSDPIFKRGDKISIKLGYAYQDKLGNSILEIPQKPMFQGWVADVVSAKPIELYAEDNMWKLKQIAAPNKLFLQKEYTWEKILTELIAGTGFKVNALTETKIGDFRTQNETVAQVIERVRKDFHLEAYFRGDELRSGAKVYIDSEAATNTFVFQQNVIEDDLKYQRLDDLILSAVCYTIDKKETTTQTKKGKTKTKQERLEILVYWDRGTKAFKFQSKKQGDYPENVEGERRSLPFYGVNSEDELFKQGVEELKKYYYEGFNGKFETFVIPYVKMGDNVLLKDNILPERNGKYKVKGVVYKGGTSGHRQEITLDYRIS